MAQVASPCAGSLGLGLACDSLLVLRPCPDLPTSPYPPFFASAKPIFKTDCANITWPKLHDKYTRHQVKGLILESFMLSIMKMNLTCIYNGVVVQKENFNFVYIIYKTCQVHSDYNEAIHV